MSPLSHIGPTLTLGLLCAYGFFKEVKPSEPYLTQYLIGPKNLTEDQVYYEVYPVWSYSYFGLLVPVFLLTDFVRYKPMIVTEGLAYVITWVLLLWAEGVAAMQFMEFMYGVATSTEIAYYTYIYAKVPKEEYKKVSSLTRSSILMGKFFSGLLSQLLVSFEVMDYRELNYISLTCVSIAFGLSILLPPAKTSLYFHRKVNPNPDASESADSNAEVQPSRSNKEALKTIFKDAYQGYMNPYIIKWSVWVAASTCLYFQIGNYIQPLWETIRPEDSGEDIYNGAVEAVTTLTGALTVLTVGFVQINWKRFGDFGIIGVAFIGGILLITMSLANNIWFAYFGYILFRMSYQIARTLEGDSTGVIFGINTWAALGLQTILTLTVADEVGLALAIPTQFLVYGSLYILTGLVFTCYAIVKCLTTK